MFILPHLLALQANGLKILAKNMKQLYLSIFLFFLLPMAYGQTVYEHVTNTAIYDFLDALANEQIISINSAVKPYSRMFIADKLLEAHQKVFRLSPRQQKELIFFLADFRLERKVSLDNKFDVFKKQSKIATSLNPVAISCEDNFFRIQAQPIAGYQFWNNSNGTNYHRWWGAEIFAYAGDNWSAYASLRDNHEKERLIAPEYFNQRYGVPVKGNPDVGGIDYSEMRGGIVYSWGWGDFGLIKDHFQWGSNYHGSNILSGRTPSFAHIKLHVKPVEWLDFNYIHGWIVSNVVDSARSYWDKSVYRSVFFNKYIAANILTITPFKNLNISFGNSVVYSADNVNPAYLIPVFFYKSVDHTLNNTGSGGESGQNSQMFFDISSRNIKYLHLYASVFLDELKVSRIKSSEEHNPISGKIGARLSAWPINDLSLTAEYTRSNPFTFEHKISTTTFASNDYNLGHYLRGNADEIYFAIDYKPMRGLWLHLSYFTARHGNEYNKDYIDVVKQPVLQDITWENKTITFKARYEILNNATVFVELIKSDIKGFDVDELPAQYYLDKYTAPYFQGDQFTVSAGFNIGF